MSDDSGSESGGEVKRKAPGFGALSVSSGDEDDGGPAPERDPMAGLKSAPVRTGGGGKKKKKGKKGKGKGGGANADDLDAVLAEAGLAPDPEVLEAISGGGKKGKKGKKGKGGKEDAVVEKEEPQETADTKKEEGGGGGGAKKSKKMAAAAKARKARQAEIEKQRALEEARLKEEEEARRLAEEEAKREEEEKERIREEKRKKIAEAKKAGTYKTKAQKKKEAEARARAERLRASGVVVSTGADDGKKDKKKSTMVRVDRKKKQQQPKQSSSPKKDDDDDDDDNNDGEDEEESVRESGKSSRKVESSKPEEDEDDADSDDWGDATPASAPSGAKVQSAALLFTGLDEEEELVMRDEASMLLAAKASHAVAAPAPPVAVGGGSGADAVAGGGGDGDSDSSDWEAEAEALAERQEEAAKKKEEEDEEARKRKQEEDEATPLTEEERIEASRQRRAERLQKAKDERSSDRLRSPIAVVMGHVDTGKTSLLDQIRRTNVQGGEAGGITQQIGATYFPIDKLRKQTDKVNDLRLEYRIPGLLVMDTPGHESFTNLRSRGSALCDIAVLVVDLMHGLEQQTIESLELLRAGKTPFIVALNKVDRCYDWTPTKDAPIRASLAEQKPHTVAEFERRAAEVKAQIAAHGLNSELYYENDDFKRNVSLVPTSAVTGEGIPDLLMLLVQLTQQVMARKLRFIDYVQASILEVKSIEGLGTTIDVILVNGELHEGDRIVVCGMNGAIDTTIRALLTPPPAREIRVKADYIHNKSISAAMGCKIAATGLDDAVAGTSLLVVHEEDYIEDLKQEVQADLDSLIKGFAHEEVGVYVQASTLGSLEALLEFLRKTDPPIPVGGVGVGRLHRRAIMQAAVQHERDSTYACVLAFDVPISREVRSFAARSDVNVRIFEAEIIYHLADAFHARLKEIQAAKRAELADGAVFPCVLNIVNAFHTKNPFIFGVEVKSGVLRRGTPICVITGEKPDGSPLVLPLGRVTSLQIAHEEIEEARPGGPSVAVRIEKSGDSDQNVTFGRHFSEKHILYSQVTRDSIDILKEYFRDEMTKPDWILLINLKKIFHIK